MYIVNTRGKGVIIMGLKLNLQQFTKYLQESLGGMTLPKDCKTAINANAITIFNKANTTRQADGSEEVLDTFEFQRAENDIDEYIETYMTSLDKYRADIATKEAKLNTMFKDYKYEPHDTKTTYFSITVNNENMVVDTTVKDKVLLIRGNSEDDAKIEEYKTLEDLIRKINSSDNNFGQYKGLDIRQLRLP